MTLSALQKKKYQLSVETLETRLNLSNTLGTALSASILGTATFDTASIAGSASVAKPITLSTLAAAKFSSPLVTAMTVGATTPVTNLNSSGTTSISLGNYSAITNCTYISSASCIGYNRAGNSSVTYSVSAPTTGTYTLNVAEATSQTSGTLAVYVNNTEVGTIAITSTGGYSTYTTKTLGINLASGTSTIRLQATGSLVYNLGGVSLVTPTTTPTTTIADAKTTALGSGTTNLALNSYSAITNCTYIASASCIGYNAAGNSSVAYTVSAAAAGTYTLNVAEATSQTSGTLAVYVNNTEVGTIAITSTGGYSTYTTKTLGINLASGTSTIRLQATGSLVYNLGGVSLVTPTTTPTTTIADAKTTALGSGTTNLALNSYSAITNCTYIASASCIGYNAAGNSSVAYTVSAAAAGTYTLNVAEATSQTSGTLAVYVNNTEVGTIAITSTGGYSTYTTKTLGINLASGTSTIRLQATGSLVYNLGGVSLIAPTSTSTSTTTTGAQTTALSSSGTTALALNTYSAITNCSYIASASCIGYNAAGNSSVAYTVSAAAAGTYTLSVAEATSQTSGTLAVYVNNTEVGTIAITSTSGYSTYTTKTLGINLAGGTSTIRLQATGSLVYNLGGVSLTAGTVSTSTTTTPPPVTPVGDFSTTPITIGSQVLTSFTQLNLTGTSGNDNIAVSQSGSTITVVANGHTSTYTGAFGNIMIHGEGGNDTITIAPSVTVESIIYGDGGSNTINDADRAWTTIVSVGNGASDTVTGNGINTSFWVDSADKVSGTAGGDVHVVASYTNGVSLTAVAPSIANPTGTGKTVTIPNASLWGTGPVITDIAQGQLADCFFNATMQAFTEQPALLRNMAVDLGDGTYAIQYVSGGKTEYLRISGALPAGGPYADGLMYAHPGASGSIWVPIMEKAYAIIGGGNNYANLSEGWMTSVYAAFGVAATSTGTSSAAAVLFPALAADLASKNPMTVGTGQSVLDGAPLIANHAYTITAIGTSNGAYYVQLRNPWGFDGAGNDSNPQDGYVVLTAAQFQANFSTIVMEA